MGNSKHRVTNNNFNLLLKKLGKRWFIDAFTGMAQGLFVTLIAGTIIKTLGQIIGDDTAVGNMFILTGSVAATLMGAGIGAGIASHLKAPKLVIFASMVAGFIGAFSSQFIGADFAGGALSDITSYMSLGLPGNPIGAYVAALMACELGMLVAGKTKLDILIVPFTCLLTAIAGAYCAYPFIWLVNMLGTAIAYATQITPFFMGIIIAVIMGVLLTMPTSSAAIWVSVASPILTNVATSTADYNAILIAGGAAVVGCACQMVGFAVMSFKENGWSGIVSQGLGTSMLQIPNVMKNPKILIPPILASIVCGPLATVVFQLKCGSSGGGMGTCGFVGIIDAYEYSVNSGDMNVGIFILAVLLLFIVLPAVICYFSSEFLRKINWIKEGDLKLPE
ncbi:MAG: PTS sugar transporter subunit IIC [Bacillota bacterium]